MDFSYLLGHRNYAAKFPQTLTLLAPVTEKWQGKLTIKEKANLYSMDALR